LDLFAMELSGRPVSGNLSSPLTSSSQASHPARLRKSYDRRANPLHPFSREKRPIPS
jgi:hypothetical protein